jgi:UDP-glucose 4-epimerase
MSEWMLRDLAAATDLRFVALRYFNVAGSDPQGRIGQSTRKATLLVKVACEASVGRRTHVSVYGSDYDTPDGTCVRDYVHVTDLCEAHRLALESLIEGAGSQQYNLGNGNGYSVQEVIEAARRVTGQAVASVDAPRRDGDPDRLVADASQAKKVLGWRPQFVALDEIVAHAWAWEQSCKQQS